MNNILKKWIELNLKIKPLFMIFWLPNMILIGMYAFYNMECDEYE